MTIRKVELMLLKTGLMNVLSCDKLMMTKLSGGLSF
jgi:hypothetical protein